MILILFVIMLIGSAPLETRAGYRSWVPYAGLALGVVMLAGMALTVLQMPPATINPAANEGGVPIVLGVGSIRRTSCSSSWQRCCCSWRCSARCCWRGGRRRKRLQSPNLHPLVR